MSDYSEHQIRQYYEKLLEENGQLRRDLESERIHNLRLTKKVDELERELTERPKVVTTDPPMVFK